MAPKKRQLWGQCWEAEEGNRDQAEAASVGKLEGWFLGWSSKEGLRAQVKEHHICLRPDESSSGKSQGAFCEGHPAGEEAVYKGTEFRWAQGEISGVEILTLSNGRNLRKQRLFISRQLYFHFLAKLIPPWSRCHWLLYPLALTLVDVSISFHNLSASSSSHSGWF